MRQPFRVQDGPAKESGGQRMRPGCPKRVHRKETGVIGQMLSLLWDCRMAQK
jgi:hypothetical protein